ARAQAQDDTHAKTAGKHLGRISLRLDPSAGFVHHGLLELVLVHPRSAGNVQLAGLLAELFHGGARANVVAAGGHAVGPGVARRLRVRRPAVALGHPAVARLAVLVLERRVGGAVRPLALAVRLDGAVVGLGVDVLGALVRIANRARHVFSGWHTSAVAEARPPTRGRTSTLTSSVS